MIGIAVYRWYKNPAKNEAQEEPSEKSPEFQPVSFSFREGDTIMDESHSIYEPGTTDFLGEMGFQIGIDDGKEPPKVASLQVWLFDKEDIQTKTVSLMAIKAAEIDVLRQQAEAIGEMYTIEESSIGSTYWIKTNDMMLQVTIKAVEFGSQGQFTILDIEVTPHMNEEEKEDEHPTEEPSKGKFDWLRLYTMDGKFIFGAISYVIVGLLIGLFGSWVGAGTYFVLVAAAFGTYTYLYYQKPEVLQVIKEAVKNFFSKLPLWQWVLIVVVIVTTVLGVVEYRDYRKDQQQILDNQVLILEELKVVKAQNSAILTGALTADDLADLATVNDLPEAVDLSGLTTSVENMATSMGNFNETLDGLKTAVEALPEDADLTALQTAVIAAIDELPQKEDNTAMQSAIIEAINGLPQHTDLTAVQTAILDAIAGLPQNATLEEMQTAIITAIEAIEIPETNQ